MTATPRKCCSTVGGEPHTRECEALWRATRDFPTEPATATHWRVIANSAGFHGVDEIAQTAADAHCSRYGHTPAVVGAVAVGSVARCTGCGRSIALLALREDR